MRVSSYWPTLTALALLCALLSLLVLVIVVRSDLTAAVADLRRDPHDLSLREMALLVLSVSIPLASAITSYMIAAQSVRLLRIALYLRRLHAYVGQRLRTSAPLVQRGIAPRVEPVARADLAHHEALSVQRILSARGPVLLTGEAGSGKTTALLGLAHDLTRPRALLPIFLGRRRLPVLVPLGRFVSAQNGVLGGSPQLALVQAQVARFGSPGLAARLPRRLRSGRALLLCDSLSDVPLGLQGHVLANLAEISGVGRSAGSGVPLVVARAATLGAAVPDHAALRGAQHWRIAPIAADDVLRTVQSATKGTAPRRASQQVKQLRDDLQIHRLDRAIRWPAWLLSYTTARASVGPLPYGRAALLQQALDAACASAATDTLPTEQLRDTLATLASAMTHADTRMVPLPPGARLGDALAGWLSQHRPYSPLYSVKSGKLALAPDVAHACCLAALQAGLLVVTSDDGGIAFANSLVEAACAATWLRMADDGVSPFDPGLLRPRWVLPVILWTATAQDPGTVTRRLLPLGNARPEGHNTLALATNPPQPRPTSAAAATLALGGLATAVAPAVSAFQVESGDHGMQVARFERRLREVLDAVLDVLTPDPDPALLAAATQAVEGEVGDELAADIAYLADYSALSRLARAQLITILGLLASPLALTALVAHLADRDSTLRSATNRGFALAGAAAVPVLQQQLASADEWTRARAREALDGVSAAMLDGGTTAQERAVRALAAPESRQRMAAAETLGTLRAYGAVDALAGRLHDADPQVRLAALQALAKLADPAALDMLRTGLRSPDSDFRAALAEALGAYHDPALLDDLALLLEDSDGGVRAAAATALGMLGDGHAVPVLLAHHDDPDPRTQAAVASALRRLGDAPEGGMRLHTPVPQLGDGTAREASAS